MTKTGIAILLEPTENNIVVTPIKYKLYQKKQLVKLEKIKQRNLFKIQYLKSLKDNFNTFSPTMYILKFSKTMLAITIYSKFFKFMKFLIIIFYNIFTKCCFCRINNNKF